MTFLPSISTLCDHRLRRITSRDASHRLFHPIFAPSAIGEFLLAPLAGPIPRHAGPADQSISGCLPSFQKFCSYCRLVHPRGESDGKLYGTQGRKQGNPYLKWAFSEAVVCSAAHCLPIKKRLQRLEQKYGLGKGKSILAHKLGRSVYHMLLHKRVFDLEKFLR